MDLCQQRSHIRSHMSLIFFLFLICIYLATSGLRWDIWDLVPWPGIEPRPPALGAWSLSHWTIREVPVSAFQYAIWVCHSFSSTEQVSFNFMAAVTIWSDFGTQEKKQSVTVSILSTSICCEVMGLNAMIFVFWMLSLSQLFHSPLSLPSRGSLVPFCFLP